MTGKPIIDADKVNSQIGKRLRSVRKGRGLSQSNVAEALGVTYQQISRYESGENTISIVALLIICQVLRVTPIELLGDLLR